MRALSLCRSFLNKRHTTPTEALRASVGVVTCVGLVLASKPRSQPTRAIEAPASVEKVTSLESFSDLPRLRE